MWQVPQEQLEPVLRCASQLKIRGLDSELSRESSMEPDRPASQQSGSSKRKTSPKFHFLKSRRKNLLPSKLEEIKVEEKETVQDDVAGGEEESGERWERSASPGAAVLQEEEPVDFTLKSEQCGGVGGSPAGETGEPHHQTDLPDMAAFIASATAAVRSVGSFQVSQSSINSRISHENEIPNHTTIRQPCEHRRLLL